MDFPKTMVQLRDNSFVNSMEVDPDTFANFPNQAMREVKSGHYVPVKPTPLPQPKLVLHSAAMAAELGLSEEHCASPEFLRFFSGDTDAVPDGDSWATPYALSIYGQFQRNGQCPFKNGCGYGDGRALSIQEILTAKGARWELQLKGAGQTPFCRGGDGRAVLRSSIREFLVSEAMHNMGVGTTRALSLIVSQKETARRPRPEEDEVGTRSESCAITCRLATSFLRIGHFELFGRRVANPPKKGCCNAKQDVQCLQKLVDHALHREFEGASPDKTVPEKVWMLLRGAAVRVANMTTHWLRVGFCQGNFNSDNCLISGRTMDYGPFGFVEEFDPNFGSWVGSGSHFAFMNQPQAGMMNLRSLFEALSPLLDGDEDELWETAKAFYLQASETAKADMWRQKLGLRDWSPEAAGLLSELLRLMEQCASDWTITWRQLAECLEVPLDSDDVTLLRPLLRPQGHTTKMQARAAEWVSWIKRWMAMVEAQDGGKVAAAQLIRATCPKFVPREWMLKEAYDAAQAGDYAPGKELLELFTHPFCEGGDREMRYYACKRTVSIS